MSGLRATACTPPKKRFCCDQRRTAQSAAASEEARAKVTEYVTTLFEAGEKDTHRLTVCGLTYLRQLDGSNDPVKAGYTGL